MQEAFINVNGALTRVVTFGRWVEESPNNPEEPEDIILIISGNPGFTSFYKKFMEILYERLNHPIWIVSHFGHDIPTNGLIQEMVPKLKGNEELFGLKSQIRHKVDFIEKFVPKNARLHLIGHSIGSYMILNLLKHESIKARVESVNLLFPTIEHMAKTYNGKVLTTFVKPIVPLILFLSWIYTLLPLFLSAFLTMVYSKIVGYPGHLLEIIQKFVHPQILENVFYLAFEELELVNDRDDEIIKENLRKIRILYGAKDGWTPKYFEKIIQDIPNVRAEICDKDHAFVLSQSEVIGERVASWIQAV